MGQGFRKLPPDVITNLESAPWRFAYTMVGIPHSHSHSRTWDNVAGKAKERFLSTALALWEHAEERSWGGRPKWYLDMNGYQYWMEWKPDQKEEMIEGISNGGDLFNRCPHRYQGRTVAYDAVAAAYDDATGWWADVEMHRGYYDRVALRGRVLDIGCGTGQAISYTWLGTAGGRPPRPGVDPSDYVGIDPSVGMLAEFALKHPEFRGKLKRTTFEHFEDTEGFDTIIGMFGSPSYVEGCDVVEKSRYLLNPGGRAYLMFYDPQDPRPRKPPIEDPPASEPPPGCEYADGYAWLEMEKEAGSSGPSLGTEGSA